jgi:DNA polymerase-4
MDGTAFRLIGIGASGLSAASGVDPVDLIEPEIARRAAAERAMDRVRSRFGRDAVIRGKLYDRHTSHPTDPDTQEGKKK